MAAERGASIQIKDLARLVSNSGDMEADSPIAQRWKLMRERLDERQRRAFAAAEAKVIDVLDHAYVHSLLRHPGSGQKAVTLCRRGGSYATPAPSP